MRLKDGKKYVLKISKTKKINSMKKSFNGINNLIINQIKLIKMNSILRLQFKLVFKLRSTNEW